MMRLLNGFLMDCINIHPLCFVDPSLCFAIIWIFISTRLSQKRPTKTSVLNLRRFVVPIPTLPNTYLLKEGFWLNNMKQHTAKCESFMCDLLPTNVSDDVWLHSLTSRACNVHLCYKLQGPHAIGTPSQHELMVALPVMTVWLQSLTCIFARSSRGLHAIGTPSSHRFMVVL